MKNIAFRTVFVIGALFAGSAFAAGMNTHGDVSQIAEWSFDANDYPDYAQAVALYQDALQAGAAFPDWGYLNDTDHDAAEAAHWNPFIQSASDYIHNTYPQPWDEATWRLVVFLFGITAHSVADISWHGLAGVDPGLIDVMSDQEFQGHWSDAHSEADTGGEMVNSHSQDTAWVHGTWYVPTQDLVEIYHDQGYTEVTESAMIENLRVQYLGSKAVKYFAWILFGTYVKDSSFLVEQYQDYFKGGLADMGIWTAWTWNDVIDWIENGSPARSQSVAPLLDDDHPPYPTLWADLSEQYLAETGQRLVVTRKARGVELKLVGLGEGDDADDSVPPKSLPTTPPGDHFQRVLDIHSDVPYASLGKKILAHDFNGDGRDDVLVSAPGWGPDGQNQRGMIAIVFGRKLHSPQNINVTSGGAQWVRRGHVEYGRFGWDVALLDFNDDGVRDLAVSSPTVGSDELAYRGRVEVFFGTGNATLFHETADVTIDGVDLDTNLGWDLAIGDLDGDDVDDLVIGAPYARSNSDGDQHGETFIFKGGAGRITGTALLDTDADVSLRGQAFFDWFGYENRVMDIDGTRYLLVGAPTKRANPLRSIGKLYGYKAADLFGGTPAPAFTLTGSADWEKIGAGFAYGDPTGSGHDSFFAVANSGLGKGGAPQSGRIYQFDPADLVGDTTTADAPATLYADGDVNYGRFGWSADLVDFNGDGVDDWFITEPWRSDRVGLEAGAAYLYLGRPDRTAGNLGTPDITLRPDVEKSRFGIAAAFPDFNGDGSPDIAVGAENDSTGGRRAGLVRVVIYPHPQVESVEPHVLAPGAMTTVEVRGLDLNDPTAKIMLSAGDHTLQIGKVSDAGNGLVRFTVQAPYEMMGETMDLNFSTCYGSTTMEKALSVGTGNGDEGDDDGPSSGDDDDDGNGCGF